MRRLLRPTRLTRSYCERFAAAGYHCLAFDYRYFGASTGQPRQLLDIPSQLADWHTAIAYVRSLPNVDPDRVGLFGTSFSGGKSHRGCGRADTLIRACHSGRCEGPPCRRGDLSVPLHQRHSLGLHGQPADHPARDGAGGEGRLFQPRGLARHGQSPRRP